jgi:hypothetical protein
MITTKAATGLRKAVVVLVALSLALALLAGSAGAQDTEPSTPGTTPPTVRAVSPAGGTTTVHPADNVTATFSEPMDPATISATTFTLIEEGPADAVPASVGYDADAVPRPRIQPGSGRLVHGSSRQRGHRRGGQMRQQTRSFTIDATPPGVAIVSGLGALARTNLSSLAWTFFMQEPGFMFERRNHPGSPFPCPDFGTCSGVDRHTVDGRSPGNYVFEVRVRRVG